MLSEKGIWPALVVAVGYPEAGALLSLAQDRPQTPTDKAINLAEDWEPGMFEVRVAGKIVREYTLSCNLFFYNGLHRKIVWFSTESSLKLCQ